MRRDIIKTDFNSSFLSCEKDTLTILEQLLIKNKPYSDILKRLLIINTPDCLTNMDEEIYQNKIKLSLKELFDLGYIRITPKIKFEEHAEIKSYIIISFDNFTPSSSIKFRDCTIHFDIICHTDYWKMDDYQLRPLKIAGYIDGILNNSRLSGIGILNFLGCSEMILDENLSGYTLSYRAVHGDDDKTPGDDR